MAITHLIEIAIVGKPAAFTRRHRAYPGYTTATHLIKLAGTAFRLRDGASLDHWRRALDDCDKAVEADHLRAEQARLLGHRAGLVTVMVGTGAGRDAPTPFAGAATCDAA